MILLDKIKTLFEKPFKEVRQVLIPHSDTVYPPAEVPAAVIPLEDPVQKRFLVRETDRKILANKWDYQLDNKYIPRYACNVSTVQSIMSLDYPDVKDDMLYLQANSPEMRDSIIRKYPSEKWILQYFRNSPQNANEVYVVLVECVRQIMGTDKFCRMECRLTAQKVMAEIDSGYAVFVGGSFGFGGHFVSIVGYDRKRQVWIVNDPRGNKNTGYRDLNGDHVEYSWSWMTIPGYISPLSIIVHSDKRIPV